MDEFDCVPLLPVDPLVLVSWAKVNAGAIARLESATKLNANLLFICKILLSFNVTLVLEWKYRAVYFSTLAHCVMLTRR